MPIVDDLPAVQPNPASLAVYDQVAAAGTIGEFVAVWEHVVLVYDSNLKWWRDPARVASWATKYSHWKSIYVTIQAAWQHQNQYSQICTAEAARANQIETYEGDPSVLRLVVAVMCWCLQICAAIQAT